MRTKWCSRKFWISVAAFLGSIAASVAGIVTDEKWITITGVVCGMLSAAIYSATEAWTDAAHADDTIFVDEARGDGTIYANHEKA